MADKKTGGKARTADKPLRRAPKKPAKGLSSTAEFEKLIQGTSQGERYILRLYITGTTPRSLQAVANIRALCEEKLPGRHDLEVIDIYQQPAEAAEEQIIAAPTLVKEFPSPPRRLIGDLSDRERVLVGLNLSTEKGSKKGRTSWLEL